MSTALHTSVDRSARNGEDLPRCIFRDLREFSPLHIETFYFGGLLASFVDLDSSILLLIQKQNPLEYSIKIDLEQLISLIDQLLELVGDFEGFRVSGDIRIDEDGIGISVNDLADQLRPDSESFSLRLEIRIRQVLLYVSRSLDP